MQKRIELFEGAVLKYCVAALLLIIPLYPKFPLFTIPGSLVSVRIEDFLIAFILLSWLVYQIRHRFEFLKDNLNKTILLYLAVGFISFLSALFITRSVSPSIGLLHTLRRVEYLTVFFVVLSSVRTIKDILFYLQVNFLAIFIIFLYAIGQKFFYFPVISTMNVEFAKGFALRLQTGARLSSTFAGHYDLGAYLVLMIPLVLAVFLTVKKLYQKILMFFLVGMSFWMLLVSASRISFFAYLVSITVTLWFLKKRLLIIPVIALSILASSMVPSLMNRYGQALQVSLLKIKQINISFPWDSKSTVISFLPEVSPTPVPLVIGGPTITPKKIREIPTPTPVSSERRVMYYGSGTEISQTEDRSASIRFQVEWPRAIRALLKNPLLGTGYSSITLATDNDYLRALGEIGLVGFSVFMLIFLNIGVKIKKILFIKGPVDLPKAVIIGIAGGMLGFLGNALFIDVFEASKVAITFWVLMGILVSMIYLYGKNNENK